MHVCCELTQPVKTRFAAKRIRCPEVPASTRLHRQTPAASQALAMLAP